MYFDEKNEKALLGACLIDPKFVLPELIPSLSEEDFYNDYHKDVYSAIKSIYPEPINEITVYNELKRTKPSEEHNPAVLTNFSLICPAVAGFNEYAKRIKELSLRRKFYYKIENIKQNIENQENKIEDIISLTSREILALIDESRAKQCKTTYSLRDSLEEFNIEVKSCMPAGVDAGNKYKTGFNDFDKNFGGISKGELVYIGGRPSMGKSTVALQWALHIAINSGPVYFCSFEIPKQKLIEKIVSYKGNLQSKTISSGPITDSFYHQMTKSIASLYNIPFHFSTISRSCQEIELDAQQIKAKSDNNLSAIFIDRLEIIREKKISGENQNNYLSRLSQMLNRMAMELNIPVICLVQLSRDVTKRGGSSNEHLPMLSDLRDSGALEQDAKMVVLIHREEAFNPRPELEGKAEIIVAKNMFGPTGRIEMIFNKEIPCFIDKFNTHPNFFNISQEEEIEDEAL